MADYWLAPALVTLREEINRAALRRDKASDGWIGDKAHASRDSDHNPANWPNSWTGVVRAVDIDEDLNKPGWTMQRVVNRLVSMFGKHPGLMSGSYIIYESRIISFDRLHEGWRPYSGSNPHDKHAHISTSKDSRYYNSTKPWNIFEEQPVTNPYPKVGRADAVYHNLKVGRGETVEFALDALFSGRPTVGGLLECGGNWPGIRRWAKEHEYSIYTGRTGDDISSNGALLVKHRSGVTDHGYTTIGTPWKGPQGKTINGRTAYWVDLVLGGEDTRVLLDHFPWGYNKKPFNAPAYIQYARLQRRWASFHVATKNLLILQDGNLSASSRLPYSPKGTANKIGARIIASRGADQIMWRAMSGSRLRPSAAADETSKLGSDHYPFKINL